MMMRKLQRKRQKMRMKEIRMTLTGKLSLMRQQLRGISAQMINFMMLKWRKKNQGCKHQEDQLVPASSSTSTEDQEPRRSRPSVLLAEKSNFEIP
ncbi:hypothetical protein Dimus_018652, partial [Dionaea muscipula]